MAQACLGACYAKLGRQAEATNAMAVFIEEANSKSTAYPGEDAAAWREYWGKLFRFRTAGAFDELMDGMRGAGLPT